MDNSSVTDASASAGWASRLQKEHWSSLAVDELPFTLTCIESRPGHEQQVPCEGAVNVCEWSHVTMPKDTKGTFWVGEDIPLSALITGIKERGFVLPN